MIKTGKLVRISLSMPVEDAFMLDQLREDLSRSAYIRQLIKKEGEYR